MVSLAVYPGSFDPITNGHLSIVKRSLQLFDKVIIAVLRNESKDSFFSLEERINLTGESVKQMDSYNVEVISFDGLLVNFCKEVGSNVIIRGLRAVSDFDYEFQLALANRSIDNSVETVFFMTDQKYSYLSSSLLRNIASLGGNIEDLAPKPVIDVLQQKL